MVLRFVKMLVVFFYLTLSGLDDFLFFILALDGSLHSNRFHSLSKKNAILSIWILNYIQDIFVYFISLLTRKKHLELWCDRRHLMSLHHTKGETRFPLWIPDTHKQTSRHLFYKILISFYVCSSYYNRLKRSQTFLLFWCPLRDDCLTIHAFYWLTRCSIADFFFYLSKMLVRDAMWVLFQYYSRKTSFST